MDIDHRETYRKAEELFNKIDNLTSSFIKDLPDSVRVDIALIDVAINYLLKVLEISLDCSVKPTMRNQALIAFKKKISEHIDKLKDRRIY